MGVQTARLGVLDDRRLQAVLDTFDLGRLLTAEPAHTGNFGQNVFVDSDRGRWVLRGNPLVDGQFAREKHAAQVLATETDVHVPWPYHYQPDPRLLGFPFAVMPHLDGIQLADQGLQDRLSPDELAAIARAMGAVAARVHRATRPTAGRLRPPPADAPAGSDVEPYLPNYAQWIAATISEIAGRAQQITAAERGWLADVVEAGLPALETFQPVVLHGDLSVYNAVATRAPDGSGWCIAGLYDLMSVHVGHPEADLARQFCVFAERDSALAQTFLRAWADAAGEPGVDHARFKTLLVWERIGIWEWAKRTGAGWWPPDMSFRDWLSGYFDRIPDPG